MTRFLSVLLGAVLAGLLLALLAFKVEVALVATLGMGTVCLAWLLAVLVLPWNLYFRARHLLAEMVRSERRHIPVDAEARREATLLERRMLRFSVGLHLFSALLLAAGSWLLGQRLGYLFAGLFLLSTLFRPAVEYYQYLHARLAAWLGEVRYPREDVVKLVQDVRATAETVRAQGRQLAQLEKQRLLLEEALRAGDLENQRRLELVARKFEETIDRLTDSQEIISGIKAFLRLVQPARGG
jgi:hypothetical protein